MIVILADDFSGAAELAGIAANCGLSAEVHTRFQPDSTADVIAVDTDTRWRTEAEAIQIMLGVAQKVQAARPSWIYKKTDSVLRGHVRAEIETLMNVTGLNDCLFIPANPSKARIIEHGHYFIQGVPLHETVFAQDPDYPRRSSEVRSTVRPKHKASHMRCECSRRPGPFVARLDVSSRSGLIFLRPN